MNKNKLILQYCPNFYKIINFEYFEDDQITEKLLKIYRKFIFSADTENEEELKKVNLIDKLLGKYVDDYLFRREMKYSINNIEVQKSNNILLSLVDALIKIFDNYEDGTTRRIYISRWI